MHLSTFPEESGRAKPNEGRSVHQSHSRHGDPSPQTPAGVPRHDHSSPGLFPEGSILRNIQRKMKDPKSDSTHLGPLFEQFTLTRSSGDLTKKSSSYHETGSNQESTAKVFIEEESDLHASKFTRRRRARSGFGSLSPAE